MNGFLSEVVTQGRLLRSSFSIHERNLQFREIVAFFKSSKMNSVIFAGMGSSLYAIDSVISFLNLRGIRAYYFNSYDLARFNYGMINHKTLVVVISQSGNSWEAAELVSVAKRKTRVVGVYNVEGSNLSKICDYYLPINCGEETSLSNKSHVLTILTLSILAQALTGDFPEEFRKDLEKTFLWIDEWIENFENRIQRITDFVKGFEAIEFIANDSSLSVAKQMALIYREGLHAFTAAWELADYAHGQYLAVKPGYVAVILAPTLVGDRAAKRMINVIIERGGKIVLLTNDEIDENEQMKVIQTPQVKRPILAMAEAIPTQLLLGSLLGPDWVKGQ